MKDYIFLDNASTTKPYDIVIDDINEIHKNNYANASSLHEFGFQSELLLKESRNIIANTLNCLPEEIVFTSGGTESNNYAILGTALSRRRYGKHIIVSPIEHPSVLETVKFLTTLGFEIEFAKCDNTGKVIIEELKKIIREDTILISIMHVNNETGLIQPTSEIGNMIKLLNKKTFFHVDAIQSYCKYSIDLKNSKIDLMSVSAHKIHGPKGCGFLYKNKGIKISPIIFGGGQEKGQRAGTENVPLIHAFALAAKKNSESQKSTLKQVYSLKKMLTERVLEEIKGTYLISPEESSAYILNIGFKYVKSQVLLHHLETFGIYVSSGSACSSRKEKTSHVLKAMKINNDIADGAIRFSFSVNNTLDDIETTIDKLKEIVPLIRYREII